LFLFLWVQQRHPCRAAGLVARVSERYPARKLARGHQPQAVLVSGMLPGAEAPEMLSSGLHGWIQAATDGETNRRPMA
jgi:hypothetical protein